MHITWLRHFLIPCFQRLSPLTGQKWQKVLMGVNVAAGILIALIAVWAVLGYRKAGKAA